MVDKNSIFGGMITTQGAAKKTNCDALGIPWEPRYMLIGDANGTDPVPNPSQTKLVNQVHRAQINQLRVSPTDANVLIAEVVLPPDVGGWWVRELALEDKDGVFSAVANAPPSYKPVLAQGSGRNQVVRMHIITSGTSNIQLKIDPSVVLATRQYVDEAVGGLLPANKPAGTYTKVTVNDRGVFVSGSNPTTLAGYGITDTYTKDQITAMIAQASALPVGSVIAFPVNKLPPGFLELDGSVQNAAFYPDLAALLAGAFNKGDEGAGNFRLPESRGEFLRGWDHGRGVDAGRAIGSMQLDSLQGFRMETMRTKAGTAWGNDDAGAGDPGVGPPLGTVTPGTRPRNLTGAFVSDGVNGVPRIGSETRSRSLAVMWCIKAWNAPINQGNIDVAALASEVEKSRNLSIQGAYRGILISAPGVGSFLSARVDQVIVKDGAGVARRISGLSAAINLAAVGANGVDVGVLAASSFYSLWAINGSSPAFIAALCPVLAGATTAGSAVVTGLPSTASLRVGMQLSSPAFPAGAVVQSIDSPSQINVSALALTTTATASLRFVYEPVLPAGYTSKARVGMFLTASNGVPYAYTQIDNILLFDPTASSNTLNYPVAVSGVASTPVSVSLANFVPPTARKVSLVAGCTGGYVGFAPEGSFASTPGTGYLSPAQLNGFPFAGGYNASGPVPTAQGEFILRRMSFLYCATAASAVTQVMGWEDGL